KGDKGWGIGDRWLGAGREPWMRDGSRAAQSPYHLSLVTCQPGSVQIERVLLERRQRRELEHVLVGRLEHDLRRPAGLPGFDPAQHVQAPAVAGLQAPEAHLAVRGDEVVAAAARELEKLRGDLYAHQVR